MGKKFMFSNGCLVCLVDLRYRFEACWRYQPCSTSFKFSWQVLIADKLAVYNIH